MADADLNIRIKADSADARAKLDALRKDTAKYKADMDKVAKASGAAFVAITAGLGYSIKQAIDAEAVDARLIQTLKNLGFESEKASKEMAEMASAIQKASRYGDEDLKDTMTALIDYTKDYNLTLQHTQTVADLAAAKKIDLATATKLVGMAFQGNTGMLTRYGIVLEEGIKGTEALAAISKRFAGAAAADANTAAGAYEQYKNAVGDLGESIGRQFLPALTGVLQKSTEVINKFEKLNVSTNGGVGKMLTFAGAITGGTAAMALIAPKLAEVANGFKLLTVAMAASPILATAAALTVLSTALLGVASHFQDINNEKIKQSVNTDNMIKKTEEELSQRKEFLKVLEQTGQKTSEAYEKELQAVSKLESKLMGLNALKNNRKVTPAGAPVSGAPVSDDSGAAPVSPATILEPELQASLEKMGIATDNFTAEQIEKYNNMYTSQNELEAAHLEKSMQMIQEKNAQEIEEKLRTTEELNAIEREKNAQRVGAVKDMFGNLSTLMSSGNRQMFEVGKAAAIAQATMDTFSGAQSAFTSLAGIPVVGPALGIAAAAAAVAAGVMRVNQIQATNFNPKGAAEGVSGSFTEPLITTLKPQEIVVPQKFSEGIRRGDYSLSGAGGSGGNTYQVIIQGDVIGVPRDDFMRDLGQKFNELIQSGSIPAGQFTGATS